MEQAEIKKILPQRYPFLYIDKVLEFEKDRKLVALKNATANEEFFSGHFPNRPIMPGVLLIEAMGQAGIVFLTLNRDPSLRESVPSLRAPSEASGEAISTNIYFLCAVKARFLKTVVPGDRILIEITPVKLTEQAGIVKAVAKVDGKEVARAELTGAERK